MSKEDHISNLKDSILSSIKRDIVHENEIIMKHKERQENIIKNISNFKRNMQSQIFELEKQITEAGQKNSDLTTTIFGKSDAFNKEIKDLENKIADWQTQNAEAQNRNSNNDTASHAELATLLADIKLKTEQISTMTITHDQTNKKFQDLNIQHISCVAARDKLLQECNAIETNIATENKHEEDISRMQTEHNRKICLEIESLKSKTDEMQKEIMTSSITIK